MIFLIAAVGIVAHDVRQIVVERRRLAFRAMHSNKDFTDYLWDVAGFRRPRWNRTAVAVGRALFLTLFLSPFNWWAFLLGDDSVIVAILLKVGVAALDVGLGVSLWKAARCFGQAVKCGGSFLRFSKFPYKLGEAVALTWEPAGGIREVRRATMALRCIDEWVETDSSGEGQTQIPVHEQKWIGVWESEEAFTLRPGASIAVSFNVPSDAKGTALWASRTTYWELEVRLDLPGLDFVETYLVPIYTRFPSLLMCILFGCNEMHPVTISRLWLQPDSQQIQYAFLIGFRNGDLSEF